MPPSVARGMPSGGVEQVVGRRRGQAPRCRAPAKVRASGTRKRRTSATSSCEYRGGTDDVALAAHLVHERTVGRGRSARRRRGRWACARSRRRARISHPAPSSRRRISAKPTLLEYGWAELSPTLVSASVISSRENVRDGKVTVCPVGVRDDVVEVHPDRRAAVEAQVDRGEVALVRADLRLHEVHLAGRDRLVEVEAQPLTDDLGVRAHLPRRVDVAVERARAAQLGLVEAADRRSGWCSPRRPGVCITVNASVPGIGEHVEPVVVLVRHERRLVDPLGLAVDVAHARPPAGALAVGVGDDQHRVRLAPPPAAVAPGRATPSRAPRRHPERADGRRGRPAPRRRLTRSTAPTRRRVRTIERRVVDRGRRSPAADPAHPRAARAGPRRRSGRATADRGWCRSARRVAKPAAPGR